MCWSFWPHVRFLTLLTVFELLPKTCNFTICSIFRNSGHICWCMASADTILKLHTLVMIQTKFGFHWSRTFRGEDFWKSLRRTTDDDDGRQVMAIAHMTLWVRWAKKVNIIIRIIIKPEVPRSLQSLTWIKAVFNNNATALWESVTAGHNFAKGPSNDYSIKVWF